MKTLYQPNSVALAVGGAMLFSLISCTGVANNSGADGRTDRAYARTATLTGFPVLDQAIRIGGDYEMLDAIYSEYVAAGSSIAKADTPKLQGLPPLSSK